MTERSTEQLINAYLDGELTDVDRQAFEQRMETDSALQQRVATLARIESGLGRIYAGAEAPEIPDTESQDAPAPSRFPWRVPLAIAACLAIVSGALFFVLGKERPDGGRIYYTIAATFEPDVVCDTPEKFAQYTQDLYGVRVDATFDGPARLVGWKSTGGSYDEVSDDDTSRALLAYGPKDVKVVVLFDKSSEPAPTTPELSSLSIFTKRLGGVTAYEITPLPTSAVLDLLELPSSSQRGP